MSDQPEPSDRLSKVLRLTAALTDRILDAKIMGSPIAEDQVHALAKAARLLQDHDVPWPPMLRQALSELAQTVAEPAAGSKVGSIKRFLGALRGDKGEP